MAIKPEIYNGNKNLIINESWTFDPTLGTSIKIPISSDSRYDCLIIRFNFQSVSNEKVNNQIGVENSQNVITFTKVFSPDNNLLNGLVNPFTFKIGGIEYSLSFSWAAFSANQIFIHFSLYGDLNEH